ncbi:MAG: diguanylate cyclase [Desulfobulbaceae bacterium]|jgi:diguanylate cyclase (GGDEF)-like protein|nr:diguanylate cyclase [Desulfobulbaceae bacterium]
MTPETEQKNSILLVDDESANLLALNKILSSAYAIFMAKNGEQALKIALESKPDLILLDVLMPVLDGFETLARLKSDEATKDIPVIFITALSNDDDEEKGFVLGARDYIKKPFKAAIVRARVSTQMQLVRSVRILKNLSYTDPLTGIANRRHFSERLEMEWKRAIRDKTSLSFLMMDIDKFKTYNDTYGHAQGDLMIQMVAKKLKAAARRPADLAARLGGEEFGLLMPDTKLADAVTIAERIRGEVEGERIMAGAEETSRTVSIGAASVAPRQGDESPDDLIARADANLYTAKNTGRNRICADDGTCGLPK